MGAGVELSEVGIDFGIFRAVDDVSINIKPGEFFSFLGPSGCGKTTILRMISGFLDPTAGQIRIGGKDMRGIGPNKRPTALIFQNLALFPLMPVWENIAFGLRVRGVSAAGRRKRAEELLSIVDLPDAGDKMIAQLSGGQKQRIAIARALAVEPEVMLLDEPLSALDLKLRQHMRSELRAIQEKTGVTFIYITHDQNEALAMSDRVAVMSKGRLQQVDTPRAIYDNPLNGFVASFVGENTRIEGRVVGMEGGLARFSSADGTFLAQPGQGVGPSAETRLYIRPENIGIGDDASPNALNARIASVVFEGNVISVVGKTSSGTEFVSQFTNRPNAAIPQIGETVRFSFDPEHAQILLADDRHVAGAAGA